MQPGDGVAWIGAFADAVRAGPRSGAGPMGLVVAPGMSGAGEALEAAAAALDRPVLRVLAIPAESTVPLGALRSVVSDLPADDVVAARERLAGDHPGTVLVVDEAHWLDDESLAVLAGLAARPGLHDLGLLVAHRPATSGPLAALDEALAVAGPVAQPDGLAVEEVAGRMAATTGRASGADEAAWLHHVTGGRLGLVDLLLESWPALDPRGRAGSISPEDVPTAVVDALRLRLHGLPESARGVLGVLAVAPEAGAGVVAAALELDLSDVVAAVGDLRAAGVLLPGVADADAGAGRVATVIPVVRAAVARLTPAEERGDLERRVGGALAEHHASAVQAARHLAAAGTTGSAAAQVFVDAAEQVGASDPALALDWYDRAGPAGGAPEAAVARAELQAWAGDLDGALERAVGLLDDADPTVRARAAATAAVVSYRRGRARQALELLATAPVGTSLGRPIALARGATAPATGEEPAAGEGDEVVGRVTQALAGAAEQALVDDPPAALARFLEAQALLDSLPRIGLVAESPAVLGAVTALVCGDAGAARELLRRATAGRLPGLFAGAVDAWRAWVEAVVGASHSAAAGDGDGGADPVGERDRLVAAAGTVAGARRAGDLRALQDAWAHAEPVLLAVEPDLWLLQPVLELAAGAVRLDPQGRATAWVDALEAVASQVGAAAPWLVALEWGRLQVALAADDAEGVVASAAALRRCAGGTTLPPGAAALVAAAEVWAEVVRGEIDPAGVEETAARLAAVDRAWDASRLVGQAAIRASDPAVARRLLVRARELGGGTGTAAAGDGRPSVLSEREAEIGRLVLEGRTHKEIGAQLFLSPKTIEHHVARIRTKLGAGSRAEMVAALRRELEYAEPEAG